MTYSVRHRPAARDRAGPASEATEATGVAVVMFSEPEAASRAAALRRAWLPLVPAATISVVTLAQATTVEHAAATLAPTLERGSDHVLLVGIEDAAATALQLAFREGVQCAGVLACGDALPPLVLLNSRPHHWRTRLRLVWRSADPLFTSDALADLLAWFRATGLDAQGTVLDWPAREDAQQGASPDLRLVRMGGAYLAELVAFALAGSQPA